MKKYEWTSLRSVLHSNASFVNRDYPSLTNTEAPLELERGVSYLRKNNGLAFMKHLELPPLTPRRESLRTTGQIISCGMRLHSAGWLQAGCRPRGAPASASLLHPPCTCWQLLAGGGDVLSTSRQAHHSRPGPVEQLTSYSSGAETHVGVAVASG